MNGQLIRVLVRLDDSSDAPGSSLASPSPTVITTVGLPSPLSRKALLRSSILPFIAGSTASNQAS
jgi:hypothetical protein